MAKISDLKVGETARIVNNNYSSYGYPKGSPVNIISKGGNNLSVHAEGKSAITVNAGDLEKIKQTKEGIEKEIEQMEIALKDKKDKLKWMVDTKSEMYDEDEFKVWQILGTMDSKSSKIDKARAIAAIVKK